MDTRELDKVLQPIHNGLVRAESVIYQAGAPAEAVLTIRSGVVKLVGAGGVARTRIVRLLGRGAAIGLESLDGGNYEHTAVALRDLNLCRIPISILRSLGADNPRLMSGLISKWREHTRWCDRWIADICSGPLNQRAGSLLRLLVDVSGDPFDAVRLPRTADLADMLGCSPEGVSRCMAELKRRGMLERVAPWTYRCDPSLFKPSADPSAPASAG